MGRIIASRARIAKAIRTVVRAAATRRNEKIAWKSTDFRKSRNPMRAPIMLVRGFFAFLEPVQDLLSCTSLHICWYCYANR
jgi:hypothetical protein